MATHNFVYDLPGGFLEPLPAGARAKILSRWQPFPIDDIEREYGLYLHFREAMKTQPAAAEIRQTIEDFQGQVAAMLPAVDKLTKNNLGGLIRQKSSPYLNAIDLLMDQLTIMQSALPKVIAELPTGHALNPRELLVSNIVTLVRNVGQTADARPNGPLCQIVGILLASANEKPSSVPAIVRPVLKNMG